MFGVFYASRFRSSAPQRLRTGACLAAFALGAFALSACSGSGKGKVVATVGDAEITQAALNHWMDVSVAGDYRELNARTSPEGLASDPPDFPRCVAAAKQIPTTSGKPLSDSELRLKCRQLYVAVKEQALSFLISELWASEQGAKYGVHVSQDEVNRGLSELRYRQWPNPAQFRRYLAEQHRTLSDERYLLKRNMITERTLKRLKAKAPNQKAFAKLLLDEKAKLTHRTECRPGYRSIQCRQYASGTGVAPTAAVLVEQLQAGGK